MGCVQGGPKNKAGGREGGDGLPWSLLSPAPISAWQPLRRVVGMAPESQQGGALCGRFPGEWGRVLELARLSQVRLDFMGSCKPRAHPAALGAQQGCWLCEACCRVSVCLSVPVGASLLSPGESSPPSWLHSLWPGPFRPPPQNLQLVREGLASHCHPSLPFSRASQTWKRVWR